MNTTENDAAGLLDKLAELKDKLDTAEGTYARKVERTLEPVQKKLDALRAERDERLGPMREKAQRLEARVKELVLQCGHTVKNDRLLAVYVKPKVTWNGERLEALMAAYPPLSSARREAEAGTVQIRAVKE